LTILDAYALVAFLAGEPAADEVAELMQSGPTWIPAANLAEAADRLGRVYGIGVEHTRAVVEELEQSTALRVRAIEPAVAWRAAGLRVRHYHRSRRPLSLADCLLLAAVAAEERLATADPDLLAVAEAEGTGWIALRGSDGRRRSPR
jgi:PIN domain nuclease of toxin-antitoxin system